MKNVTFSFNALEWKKQLLPLFAIVNKSSFRPILSCVQIKIKNGMAKIYATDLETSCMRTLPVETNEECSFCLNADFFRKFICTASGICENCTLNYKLVTGNCFIELAAGDFRVKTSSINKRLVTRDYTFRRGSLGLKSGDYYENASTEDLPWPPAHDECEDVNTLVMASGDFCPYVRTALPFVSTDDLRPAMTGISFAARKGHIEIAATDAHRLYFANIIPLDNLPPALEDLAIILPQRSALKFLDLFKTGDITIHIGDKYIWFEGDTTSLCCRLINAKYPKYETVINSYDLDFYLKRSQLKSFLAVAALFCHKDTNQIALNVTKASIAVEGGDFDIDRQFSYLLPVYNMSREVIPFRFSLNLRFLRQIIAFNAKDEYVKINHSGGGQKSMVVDDHFLLMPLMDNS